MLIRGRKRRKRRGRYHTGVHVSTKSTVPCKYRSGWELEYMRWLDACDDVVSYSYESLKIPYVSNVRTGRLRTYLPDFVVVRASGTTVVEIKPKRRVRNQIVQKKLRAAAAWCESNGATLEILTEVELRLLGLLAKNNSSTNVGA